MSKRPKVEKSESDTHPETKTNVSKGVADERSSKVAAGKNRDGRSGQDKDGNEQQSPAKAAPR